MVVMVAAAWFLLSLCACLCGATVVDESVDVVDEKNEAFNEWFSTLLPNDSTETKPPNQVEIRSWAEVHVHVYVCVCVCVYVCV